MGDLVTTLSNGLQVILREVHSAPVISFWLAYHVGSRNERTGYTGISHWVEHMMFKGTEKFPAGVLDREVDRAGGQWNAFTSTDYTMYYATLPASRIRLALEAESDRMMSASFDHDETESERTVIISERQGSENSPMFWLNEALHAAAFRVHGYHHTIIGDMADLHSMTRNDLYAHYRRYYVPSNALVVAVGAFDAQEMLAQVDAHFGHLPAVPKPEVFVRPEPEPQGERRVMVERPGVTAFLNIAYHVPESTHEDWFKLEIIDSVLTGAGSGVESKTNRLYKALIKTGIAASIDGGMSETIDPYLYEINITLNDGYSHEEAEEITLQEIARIQNEGITRQELDRARKQARAAFAYSTESVTNQAFWLAQSALLGDLNWYDHFIERLNAVTLDDVQSAAQRYLIPRRRVVGWLIPTGTDGIDDLEELV
ncbi:MAG: M16 family metallopeptidase [Anaerolineae bacterium]